MQDRTTTIVRIGVVAGLVAGIAGLVALVCIGLFFWIGQPWGTLNDLALLVMTAALAPLMLSFYELGGLTPLRPAQLAQTVGWVAVAVWCVTHLLFVTSVVDIDYEAPASGALAVESWATLYIGLWIGGANLLAGPWLGWERWLGVIAGLGVAVYSVGMLLDGMDSVLTSVGGIGYLLLLPIWALFMARLLRGISMDTEVAVTPARPA
jgi:hypothetical protein